MCYLFGMRRPQNAGTHSPNRLSEVVPTKGGWAVKSGRGGTSSIHGTKDDAVKAAKTLLEAKGGGLVVHTRDGRVGRESFTIGRDTYEKIIAVEGVSPSSDAKRRAREFDRRGLSSEERRSAIIDAYLIKS